MDEILLADIKYAYKCLTNETISDDQRVGIPILCRLAEAYPVKNPEKQEFPISDLSMN